MGKTYLYGKIGKSVKFNPNTWSGAGGDNEAPTLITAIARLNPNDTFIIIGKNDIKTAKKLVNIPSNIIDIYDGCDITEKKDINFLIKKLLNIKIDGCFLMSGPTANVNIPNKSWKRIPLKSGIKEKAKVLETFANYVAPIYNYLNESNIPWIMIANDPRYIKQGNDLTNQPKMILSQYNEIVEMRTFDNWNDQNIIIKQINSVYAGMEKIFLINTKKPSINDFNKTIKFLIPLNEGKNGVKSRYNELKKYVLNYIENVDIYGDWNDEIIKNDKRFKGIIPFHKLQNMLDNVKYSFMISISDGWATMKYWELISHGVIPFMHPNYDTQKNINVPDFIRILNPKDLHNKIEMLESDQTLYHEILNKCINCIVQNDINGLYLSNIILENTPVINNSNKLEFKIKKHENNINEW